MGRHKGERSLKVYLKPHNVELGFSVTVHKIQGKTVDKITIDFNYRPWKQQFEFHSLMVAISRVREAKNIRILEQQPGNVNSDYLIELKPNPKLVIWLAGYGKPISGQAIKWSIKKGQTALDLSSQPTPVQKRPKKAAKSVTVTVFNSFAEFIQTRQT